VSENDLDVGANKFQLWICFCGLKCVWPNWKWKGWRKTFHVIGWSH